MFNVLIGIIFTEHDIIWLPPHNIIIKGIILIISCKTDLLGYRCHHVLYFLNNINTVKILKYYNYQKQNKSKKEKVYANIYQVLVMGSTILIHGITTYRNKSIFIKLYNNDVN